MTFRLRHLLRRHQVNTVAVRATPGGRRHQLESGIVDPVVLSEHVVSEGDSLTETTGAAFDAWGQPASADVRSMHGSVDPRVGMEA